MVNQQDQQKKEISKGTGVPTDFVVAYEHPVEDCGLAESKVHERLAQYRVNNNREFFKIPVKDAIETVRDVVVEIELHSDEHDGK